eukprot:1027041_1
MDCISDTAYRNTYDDYLGASQSGYIMSGVYSEHSNHNEDRIFKFDWCKPVSAYVPYQSTQALSQTAYDALWTRSCSDLNGGNAAMTAVSSAHSGTYEDRVFTFTCGLLDTSRFVIHSCSESSNWENVVDEVLDFQCNNGGVIRSITSYHTGAGTEDRLFKFECCALQSLEGYCWIGGESTAECVWEWNDGTDWDYTPTFDDDGGGDECDYPEQPYTCIQTPEEGKLHDCSGSNQYYYPICNAAPTQTPTTNPSLAPTQAPTRTTITPTKFPTEMPSITPTTEPTVVPTIEPTSVPTLGPTKFPTTSPTKYPTKFPTEIPTFGPTETTQTPSIDPSLAPTQTPTLPSTPPTANPTPAPTHYFGNLENCTSTCTATKWVEIAYEPMGGQGTDEFRWLDFGDIYTRFSVCNMRKYKIEWNYDDALLIWNHHITFELADSHKHHHIFEDTLDSIDELIYINVIESTKSGLPIANDQLFCKKCSSYDSNRPGNTCWGLMPATWNERNCGCNQDGWTGTGVYYGGYMPGECNCRTCTGGGFSGWKNDAVAKGGVASWGLRISIEVCDNVEREHEVTLEPTGGIFDPDLSVAGWRECPEGYVMSGFYASNCTSMNIDCLQQIKCVTPLQNQTIAQTCYNHSLSQLFNGSSMTVECDSGYFVRGIRSDVSPSCGVDCWDTLRCCMFDEDIIEYDTVSDLHDWSFCVDGTESNWCDVNTNEYMTGFSATSDHWFNATTTRHLMWSTIQIQVNCDDYLEGIYYRSIGDADWNLLELDSALGYPTFDWHMSHATRIPYYLAANCASIKVECDGHLNAGGIAVSIGSIYNRSNTVVTGTNGRYYLMNTTHASNTLFTISDAVATSTWGAGLTANNAKWMWMCENTNCGTDIVTSIGFDFCTAAPTSEPTAVPTIQPTSVPTLAPTQFPTTGTTSPTKYPTKFPTEIPTFGPTETTQTPICHLQPLPIYVSMNYCRFKMQNKHAMLRTERRWHPYMMRTIYLTCNVFVRMQCLPIQI